MLENLHSFHISSSQAQQMINLPQEAMMARKSLSKREKNTS